MTQIIPTDCGLNFSHGMHCRRSITTWQRQMSNYYYMEIDGTTL